MIQLACGWKAGDELRRFLTIGLLLAVALAVTGCGKQSEKSVGPPESLTMAYVTHPTASLVHVAFVKGFFAEEGLQVNPQPHAFGKPALGAVLQGQADLATVAETPVMFAILNGKKISVAAVIETSNRNLAIIARKDLGIASPRDLKGKTIGVAMGSNGEFFLDSFLTAQGINRREVNLTNMSPDEMLAGLLTEKIAAAAIWNPILILGKTALGEKGVIFYGEEFYTEHFCIAGNLDFTKKHPEAMIKVLKALLRAEDFVKQHPEEARNLVAGFIKTDPAALRAVWDDYRFKVTLDQSLLVTLEDVSRWAIGNQLVKNQVMPNYLDFIQTNALSSAKPERVRIIR
jgi:NitT/TauT family transport system substrate-binding protein